MPLNFYELYSLLNEYGESLVQTLIQKFKQELPTLTPTIIRSYIERFERIKNNLSEKDITKLSWKELENTVDSYQPKQRIKAGKLDPTVTDANLLYNKDNIRIYLGKDKKSCIRYSNGYTFCIGARGKDNMYSHYRITNKGTPYFIFNDNLPNTNKAHLMVLIVFEKYLAKNVGNKRYSLTLATNNPEDEKQYDSLETIKKSYPWMKAIENFVDDEKKGDVEVEPIERIENLLQDAFNDKAYDIQQASSHNRNSVHVKNCLNKNNEFLKNYKKMQSYKNPICLGVKRYGSNAFIAVYELEDYENFDKLIKDLKNLINKTLQDLDNDDDYVTEYKNKLYEYIENNTEIKEVFNSSKIAAVLNYSYKDGGKKIVGEPHQLIRIAEKNTVTLKEFYNGDVFMIILFSKDWLKQILDQDQSIKELADLYQEHNTLSYWINQRTPEQLEQIAKELPDSWINDFPNIFINTLYKFKEKFE